MDLSGTCFICILVPWNKNEITYKFKGSIRRHFLFDIWIETSSHNIPQITIDSTYVAQIIKVKYIILKSLKKFLLKNKNYMVYFLT